MWFVLILLLLAAALGILGAVLKAVAFLVLTAVLTVVALGYLVAWWFRRQLRRAERALDGGVVDVRGSSQDARRDALPPTHDDRY